MANIMRLGGGSAKVRIVNVGTVKMGYKKALDYGSTFSAQIDIKSKVPNYKNLTKDNIIFGLTQANSLWRVYIEDKTDWAWNGQANMNVTYDYDASNGLIKFTGKFTTTGGGNNCGFTSNVYVIDGSVERV